MSAYPLTPERLELCRIVREHCYQAVVPMPHIPQDDLVVELAEAALEVPIETLASWVRSSETMMGNIRLVMTMVQQQLID
jgi:hypothetical protein